MVQAGYCTAHRPVTRRKEAAAESHKLYTAKWQKYRMAFLANNPLCVACLAVGFLIPATVVDHIKPHRGNHDLFLDPLNHQALCKRCHDSKTAREDGGFGRLSPVNSEQ